MSRTLKILIIVGLIILGYGMIGIGWTTNLPSSVGMFLFFGGALLVLCSGVYGLIKMIGLIIRSFKEQ
jgi:hypothetical protein